MSGWNSNFNTRRKVGVKRMKPLAKKSKSISKLKKEAWSAFSQYIRLKYADRNTGFVGCVTCGARKHYKEMQAGHFTDGRRNATLFDERNVHPQCVKCNMFNGGAKVAYYDFMREKYGQNAVDELKIQDRQERKFTRDELIEMANKYKMAAEDLLNQTGGSNAQDSF